MPAPARAAQQGGDVEHQPTSHRYAGVRRTKDPPRPAGLGMREFLRRVETAALVTLPPDLARAVTSRVRFSLLQLHFGDPTVHYEVWVQRPRGGQMGSGAGVEVGLHFEGRDGQRNRALLAFMVGRAAELVGALGPGIEPEEWTPAWTRLHERLPLEGPLDAALAEALGRRLARWATVCQPILAAR